jgi:hypothetical protein
MRVLRAWKGGRRGGRIGKSKMEVRNWEETPSNGRESKGENSKAPGAKPAPGHPARVSGKLPCDGGHGEPRSCPQRGRRRRAGSHQCAGSSSLPWRASTSPAPDSAKRCKAERTCMAVGLLRRRISVLAGSVQRIRFTSVPGSG